MTPEAGWNFGGIAGSREAPNLAETTAARAGGGLYLSTRDSPRDSISRQVAGERAMIPPVPRSASLVVAICVAAVLLPAPALAGPAPDGWFIQLYTGLGLTEDSDLRVQVPAEGLDLTFSRVSWEDYSLSRPSIPYIGVRAGRWFERRPGLGLAVDIFHYKVFARTERLVDVGGTFGGSPVSGTGTLDRFVQSYNVGNGVNMVMLTGLARLRRGRTEDLPDGRWRPYVGLGLGGAVLYTHSTVLGESRQGYEAGRLAAQVLAGVEVQVARRFALFGEVKRSRTDADGSVAGGGSETRLDSSHFVLGGSYRF